MFHSAYLKLTAFYVLIVMIISVSFSLVLYRISSQEIGQGLNRQTSAIRSLPNSVHFSFSFDDLEQMRLEQLATSSNRLKLNLIYFNLLILVLSSGASYFLAKRTLRPIEEMVDAQNRFTADASHELRTPLTAMKTEIEISMRDKSLSVSDVRQLLGSNLEEIGKLEYLSGALLKLARFKDDLKKDFRPVEIAEVIKEATEKASKLANEKSISIEGKVKKLQVLGDRQSLVELLIILLDNAIKYSPEKSTISIEAFTKDKQVVMTVTDEGQGIKASDLPHIFDRFYRADTSRNKEKIAGYGLGLAIAKQIVELHGGTISAESHPGQGSVFTIKIPLES